MGIVWITGTLQIIFLLLFIFWWIKMARIGYAKTMGNKTRSNVEKSVALSIAGSRTATRDYAGGTMDVDGGYRESDRLLKDMEDCGHARHSRATDKTGSSGFSHLPMT